VWNRIEIWAVVVIVSTIPDVVSAQAESNRVQVEAEGAYRIIRSNGIPDHETGRFPNRGNPNAISAQEHRYRIPLEPRVASKPVPLGLSPFGVALNGVPFDPGAAEFWNRDRRSGWQYEALSGAIDLGLDFNNAHVQPGGAYHYHGIPPSLVAGAGSSRHSALIGFAADGFPIYSRFGYRDGRDPGLGIIELASSYRLRRGNRGSGPGGVHDGSFVEDYEYVPALGDLDECNGRTTKTPEYPSGTYAYFLTQKFPVIPRCLKGLPDQSFIRRPGRHRRPPPPGRPPPDRRGPPH
jgi:hypothetical protein